MTVYKILHLIVSCLAWVSFLAQFFLFPAVVFRIGWFRSEGAWEMLTVVMLINAFLFLPSAFWIIFRNKAALICCRDFVVRIAKR